MRPGTPLFVGDRLSEAREARGLSVAALADLVDVSRETIYQLEDGRITPGPALFSRLHQSLRMPPAFFFGPDEEPAATKVLFRSLSSATRAARFRARRRLRWLERITGFVRTFVEIPDLDVPLCVDASDPLAIRDEEIERAAEALRQHWALGKGPISNMTWLLENRGVIVAREDLAADQLDAVLLQRDSDVLVILGADKGTAVRSRLDAAHELGHVALHRNCPEPSGEKDPRHKVMEQQAFRFAGAFLLPAESFANDLWSFSLDEFVALKLKFRVSVAAMIMRARRLDLVSETHERRLWSQYSRRGWKRGEPFDDEWAPEQPVLLRRSFELMLDQGGISVDHVLGELRLDPSDVEDLAGLPRGTMSSGPTPIAFRGGSTFDATADDKVVAFRR